MTPFLAGFADELEKTAILGAVAKRVGHFAVKHPWEAILGATTAIGAGTRAAGAYKEGLKGGEKPRYLSASVNEGAGPEAYTNFNQFFERKPTQLQKWQLGRYYNEDAYKR